jgi:Tfp pilus assembly protein PilF
MGHYIPLTWMTLGMDYLLWGLAPAGYHLTNLLLHATNAGVFYFVVLRVLIVAMSRPSERRHALALAAGFAALLFALHPLRVESVAWATERRDVLSGLFYLLTIMVYLRTCERKGRGRSWYWLSVTLFGCALLSKSMAVSLPVVLLILDVYPLRRLGGSVGWWSEPARRVYAEKLPFVVLAAVACAVAFTALFALDNMASLGQLSVLGRLAVSTYSVSFYLWKMIVPFNLSPLYPLPPSVNPWETRFLLSYGLVLTITAVTVVLHRRLRGLAAAGMVYVVVLLPVLGIFQNGPQVTADRYTYLAGLGWAVLAGAGVLSCCRGQRALPLAAIAVGGVLGLGVLTWNQVQVWHDSERLWTYALAIDPDSAFAHNNLGDELDRQGKPAEAIEHFRQALRLNPDYAEAENTWGVALGRQGRLTEAMEHFQQALRIKPDYVGAHANWGAVLLQQGEPAQAIEHFRQVLRIKPDLAEAHANWGAALIQQGKPAQAIEHFQQALRVKPDLAEAHANWGAALLQQGKPPEAAEHLQEALRIKPDMAEARANLALALTRQDKPAEAAEH